MKNFTAIRCAGPTQRCLSISGIASTSSNNFLENIFINGSLGSGIYLDVGFMGPNGNLKDNLFKDIYIENTSLQNVILSNSGTGNGTNNTFLNATYSTELISITNPQNQLIRKWYYKAYVNDTYGNLVNNVNVSAWNLLSQNLL
jgi:hypothetical protein